ncbi:collagen alpha-1(I) chain-like [Dama dama]|uniref:collagen alpha-1(I) chain-like n=1 Tax=Dama dama TaxID=30532 RepID=UPI002A36B931|nr:collagen alpha-1(I) chain-like [Dama dama]XP_060994247.1 collagen alpha-1(I) chain-like [Dama dama]XP_060994250.1 collagen alpha-1(I) chain-like [Dama dama]XP_060994251.1 collagen alpha-1(I) chain-like [Dama dama]XP_061022569.1 collagen alpha-1(I) chain-like [Dama dama]
MHGLIFETSICYWQDQPGRGASTRSRVCREQGGGGGPGRGRAVAAGEPRRPARRGSGEKGVWSGRRPPDPPAPTPAARTPDRAHNPRSTRDTARRAGRHRVEERGEGRGGPPSSSAPHPLPVAGPPAPAAPGAGPGTPGRATPRTADAPSSARPSRPPQRGGGRRAARTRRPARGRQTGDPTRARESASEQGARRGGGWWEGRGGGRGRSPSPSPRRRRRTGGGGKAGNGSGPRQARGSETRQGAAPGSSRWGADRGGRTEKGTDGVRPRDTNATEPAVEAVVAARHREGDGSKRPGGSESAARAHRGISPPEASQHRGGPEGAHPSRGLTPTANPTHPEPQPAQENALPPRTGGPHSPHTRNPAVRAKAPPAPPPSQGSEGPAPPGDATGRRRPGDDTHVRRGQLGPRPRGTGVEGDTGGRTRGTRRKAGSGGEGPASTRKQGSRDGGEGAARRPENTRTQPGHQGNQRGIPPPPTHEGGPTTPGTPAAPGHPWSGPHTPAPPPGPACRPPTFLHPSIHPQQIRLPSKSDPEAQHPGDTLSSEGGPDRGPTTPPPAAAQGQGRARQAPPHHGCGAGGAGADQAVAPQPPRLPPGLTPRGRLRAHSTRTAPHPPNTRRGPAGPSPNSEGGGAGRIATVATAHSGGAAAGGSGTPRLPLGSLEKAFSPRVHRPSPNRLSFGPTEAHQEPPLNWAGGVCGIGKRATTQERVRGHLRDDLEHSRGTTEGPTRHAHTPMRGARGMAAAQPSPPQGGPLAGSTPGRRSKRICCVQSPTAPTRHPKAGDGRPKVRAGGHTPTPAFLTLPDGQGGKTGEGPRGQTEKSGHVHWERPSLVRHGLGPARESTTTPHQSVESRWRVGGGGEKAGRRHRRGQSPEGPALNLTGNLPPVPAHNLTPQARAANDPRRRTPDTWHGAYRAGVVPATTGCPQRGAQGQRPTPPCPTALGSPRGGTTSWVGQTTPHRRAGAQAQAGGSSSKGRTRRQLAAHRPRAPRASRDPKSSVADTKGDRVSTYLVAKNTYFGRQNDSRRQRGPSTTRKEGPRNLDPATCPQHYPMNTRPGALGGHLAYRSVRVSERGFDFDVHKEKRRKNRQRGASNKTSGPRPGPTPGAQTVLHRAPRTARAGPHPPPD